MKVSRTFISAAALFAALIQSQTANAACDRSDPRKLFVDDHCLYEIDRGDEMAVLSRGKTMFDVVNRNTLNYGAPGATGPVDFRDSTDFSFVNEGAIDAYQVGLSVRDSRYFGLANEGSIYGYNAAISIRNSSEFDLINSGTVDSQGSAIVANGVERFYLLNTETGVIKGRLGSSLEVNGIGEIIVENYGRMENIVSFQSAARMLNAGYIDTLGTSGGSLELHQRGYIENAYLTVGGNTLYIEPGASFGSSVEFNNTAANKIYFAPGSYTMAVKNFVEADNDVTLYNRYQSLVVTGDPADEAVLDVVQSNGASALPGVIGQQIGAISDIVGGISPQGGALNSNTALAYASEPTLTGAAAAVTDVVSSLSYEASRFFWLTGYGGGGRDQANLTDTAHAGLVTGYEIRDGVIRAGFLGGIGRLSNDGPPGTGSVDADTAFAGAYYGGRYGAYDVNAQLLAGGLRAETTRVVSLGDPATGSYNGWYVAPELAASHTLAYADGWSLTPGARLRYVGTWLGSYSETGSVQNVSYDDRSSHVVEASLQMRLGKAQTFENGMNLRFDLSAALVESLNLGAPRYDATLVNTAFTTSAFADRAVTGGTFEASAELNVTDSFSVYGGGRLAFYSDDSWWWSAKGGVKVDF